MVLDGNSIMAADAFINGAPKLEFLIYKNAQDLPMNFGYNAFDSLKILDFTQLTVTVNIGSNFM